MKSLAALFVVCSTVVLGVQSSNAIVHLFNNAGKEFSLYFDSSQRWCECLSNTQTARIQGENGGVIKLFSSTDCTGNYDTLGSNSEVGNAQWVNSISFGNGAIKSTQWPNGCPNLFA
ncbi:hypothetical protein BGZ83_008229 [Gryganskiella cystojenkinii]|nr:hypothetical protein BGZ83_008229 [Gryganskiella cystojenkinii]